MKLFLPAVISALALTHVDAWSLLPQYYGSLAPTVWDPATRMIERQQNLLKKAFNTQLVSPRYEISDNDEHFKISLDVPGVKLEDIHVSIEDDSVLSITGHRRVDQNKEGESHSYSSQFMQSFSIDPTVVKEKFTANLKDGVLVISAPKDLKKMEDKIRKIPITEAAADETEAKKDHGEADEVPIKTHETIGEPST